MPLAIIDPEACRATGRYMREVAEAQPPVNVALPRPTIPARCIRQVPAIHAQAIITRDTGHVAAGVTALLGADNCLHLSLAFRDAASERWLAFDHAAAVLLCEGVFGDWLPLALCSPHNPMRGRQARDGWHYRVFCAGDWSRPLPDVRPDGQLPWLEYRARVADAEMAKRRA